MKVLVFFLPVAHDVFIYTQKGVKYAQYAQTSTRVHVASPRSKCNLSFPTGNTLPRHKGSYLIKITNHSVMPFTPNWYKYFLICSSITFSINVLIVTPLCIFIFATSERECKLLFSLEKRKKEAHFYFKFLLNTFKCEILCLAFVTVLKSRLKTSGWSSAVSTFM